MAKRSWDKDRERRQMTYAEPAFPKTDKPGSGFRPPPRDLPAWMQDKTLLPKKPPGKSGPK